MIYFIEDQDYRIKIGYTASLGGSKKRAANMHTGNASKLNVICEFEGSICDEQAFHRVLSNNRVAREWFYGAPRDYRFHNLINLARMDGTKVLSMDTSEIDTFVFLPEFAAKDVFVINQKPVRQA